MTCWPGSRWARCSAGCIASWRPRISISPSWPSAAREIEGFQEAPRWQALAEIQKQYLGTLDRLGLWDLQTARLVAIRNHECRTDGPHRARSARRTSTARNG